MRILLFSTLFPNAATPSHGIFVANRLEAFKSRCDAEIKVVAPVPWFPFGRPIFGAYGEFARAPRREMRGDIEVFHPRYFIPPKTAMRFAPAALAGCLRKTVRELITDGWDFDLIDAHYFYPDGVAAVRAAREFDKPVVVTARGTDINLIPEYAGPRRAIIDAASRADAVITVASALKSELAGLGVDEEKVRVLRNGVDLDRFRETDRDMARSAMELDGLVLASVGHLIKRKGHDLVIKALPDLPNATLLVAGDGPEHAALVRLARDLGVGDRVKFLGRMPHEALREIYSAADILVLASSREGWPNVLLEAMACGTPCVATNVGGSGEVIRSPEAGRLVDERTPQAVAAAITSLSQQPPDRQSVRSYAAKFSWDMTIDGMMELFGDLQKKERARRLSKTTPISFQCKVYRPRLIVTVDTEEQFDWNNFSSPQYAVNEVDGVDRFQTLCSQHEVRPLYFLTWPVLNHQSTAAYFQNVMRDGVADVGLHLHQWATPPGEYNGAFLSFQKNLPREAHRKKLHTLADEFERIFGQRARSHRAGRYGIAPEDYGLLSEIGVEFDFSPSAAFDFSAGGGPDFSHMSNRPFVIESESGRVFVTPVCGARAIKRTRIFIGQEGATPGFPSYRRDFIGSNAVSIRLSPEGAGISDLKAITRRLIADRTPVLTFTMHSTSFLAKGNAYVRDAEQVKRLFATIDGYLSWFTQNIEGELITLADLQSLYRARGN